MFTFPRVRYRIHVTIKQVASRRAYSNAPACGIMRSFADGLASKQPCFSVSPDNVQVLGKPSEFYAKLLNMIRGARRRIFISSLYIGSSERELVNTLRVALERNPILEVHLQLDYNRSTRPGPASTTTLLLPLLQQFPNRVNIYLFKSPKLKGLVAKLVPPRFNEGWGTWHAKVYGADEDVMVSGANLNKSYFTDRQDRYICFTRESAMANYCFAYLKTAASFSHKLLPSAEADELAGCPVPVWSHTSIHPERFERSAGEAFRALQASFMDQPTHRPPKFAGKGETLIFPMIQAGQLDVREEESCIDLLFRLLSSAAFSGGDSTSLQPLVNLTSGYFSLYGPYQKHILQLPINTRIICAAPSANGFYGSKGISGLIPEGYTLFEQRFMHAVRKARRMWTASPLASSGPSGVELTEWHKDSWTYHAKGIWLSPTPSSSPSLTLFGSTNLNSRSAHLDTELSFMMVTSSPALQEQLRVELEAIRANTEPWKGDERHVRLITKILVALVGGML